MVFEKKSHEIIIFSRIVARRLRINVHDNNEKSWKKPHRLD